MTLTFTELTTNNFVRILNNTYNITNEDKDGLTARGKQEQTPHLHTPLPEQIRLLLSLELRL